MKHNKKLLWQLPFLAFLIIGTVYIVSHQQSMPYQHNQGFVFGTVYNITYQSDKDLQPEIEAELRKVDNSLSTFNKESIISKINSNRPTKLNEMFVEVSIMPSKSQERPTERSTSPWRHWSTCGDSVSNKAQIHQGRRLTA